MPELKYKSTADIKVPKKMIDQVIRDFQYLNHDIKFSKKPIVVAKKGMALGGGCELGYGGNIRAAHDSFMGLVELGVGLIPGGGGIKEGFEVSGEG